MLIKYLFKRALLVMCPLFIFGIISCAGFFSPQAWGDGQQKDQAYADKKIRILIGPFTGSDRSVKEYSPGKVTTSVSNDGLEVQNAIKNKLMFYENKGIFQRKGVYVFVRDTERPDHEETDLAVYGSVGNDHIYAELVDLRTGKIIYTDEIELSGGRSPSSGGKGIATGLFNFLNRNMNELL
jgi:hypothetical protein